MAFGVQQPLDYSKDVSTLDIAQLSGQVQTALQQRFDVNSAKMEEMIQQISSVPLLQDASKKYLYDRVQGALDIVNADLKATQGRGLLSSNTTNSLGKHIQASIDDTVKKHIQYSQSIHNFDKSVNDLRQKDPKTYAQKNYDFAKYQAGYDEYLKGDVNSNLGSLQYTAYTDVMANATKKAEDLKKLKGDQVIETVSADGRKQIRTLKGLTAEEIIQNVPGFLSSEDERQIAIDGWDVVRRLPDNGASQLSDYYQRKITNNSEYLVELKAKNSSNTSASELEKVHSKIADLESSNSDLQQSLTNVGERRPEEIGYILNKQNIVNSMARSFAGRESIEYEVDDHWKTIEEFRRDDRNYNLQRDEFNLELAKEGRRINEATGAIESTTSIGLGDVSTEPVFNQNVEELSGDYILEQVQKGLDNTKLVMEDTIMREFYALPNQEAREVFTNQMKKNGFTLNQGGTDFIRNQGSTTSKASALNSSYLKVRGLNYGSPLVEVEMADLEARRLQQQKSINDAITRAQPVIATVENAKGGYNSAGTIGGLIDNTSVGIRSTIQSVTGTLNENIGNELKKDPNLAKVFSQYNAVISGNTAKNIIDRIDPSSVVGASFDPKKNMSVTFDKSTNEYVLKQYSGLSGSGDNRQPEYSEARISRAEGSSLSGVLGGIVDTEETIDYLDSRSVPNNVPIRPYKPAEMADSEDEIKHKIIMENIAAATQGDSAMAEDLLGFASKTRASKNITAALLSKGLSEQEANQMAYRIIDKTMNGDIKIDILPTRFGWWQRVNYDGKSLIPKQIGVGTQISKRENLAVKLVPAQVALLSIYNTINNQKQSIEDIDRLYGKLFK